MNEAHPGPFFSLVHNLRTPKNYLEAHDFLLSNKFACLRGDTNIPTSKAVAKIWNIYVLDSRIHIPTSERFFLLQIDVIILGEQLICSTYPTRYSVVHPYSVIIRVGCHRLDAYIIGTWCDGIVRISTFENNIKKFKYKTICSIVIFTR